MQNEERQSKIGADKRLKGEANAGHPYLYTPAAAFTPSTSTYFFKQIPSHFSDVPELFLPPAWIFFLNGIFLHS